MSNIPSADAPLTPEAAPARSDHGVIPLLKVAGKKGLTFARWAWSIPLVKSEFTTLVIQKSIKSGLAATIAVAAVEKLLGSS